MLVPGRVSNPATLNILWALHRSVSDPNLNPIDPKHTYDFAQEAAGRRCLNSDLVRRARDANTRSGSQPGSGRE